MIIRLARPDKELQLRALLVLLRAESIDAQSEGEQRERPEPGDGELPTRMMAVR